MYPSAPICTFVRPAATAWLPAVVNAGQLNCSTPEPGWPLATYTVPCTVVVVNCCAPAPALIAMHATHATHKHAAATGLLIASFISYGFLGCGSIEGSFCPRIYG